MNSLLVSSSLLPNTPPLHRSSSFHPHYTSTCCNRHFSASQCLSYSISPKSPRNLWQPVSAVTPSNDGATSVVNFDDFMEKDWSFLETDNTNNEFNKMKTSRVISAGEIEKSSKVLVSIGSEGFVDQMVEMSPCQQLVVIHDSLLTLACIKEKYDNVNCWQGELINLPEKWLSFDAMFLYFLPALPFELDEILGSLANRCLPGTRLIISHLEGREVLEQQRHQHPDVIVSNLPDKLALENAAADHSFKMTEFVDEPGFYLAVLKFEAKS